jgi:DNA-binding transcriptional LysR family regulator
MDWDDVRVFLAVAREGSMRAAGRALGLSQPTIARRLAAFEATFGGATLFDRLPEGLRLNAAGEQLVLAAEGIEDAVLTLERRRAAASPVLSGTVRVSTGECAAGFLARCLSESTTTPLPSGITLELVCRATIWMGRQRQSG